MEEVLKVVLEFLSLNRERKNYVLALLNVVIGLRWLSKEENIFEWKYFTKSFTILSEFFIINENKLSLVVDIFIRDLENLFKVKVRNFNPLSLKEELKISNDERITLLCDAYDIPFEIMEQVAIKMTYYDILTKKSYKYMKHLCREILGIDENIFISILGESFENPNWLPYNNEVFDIKKLLKSYLTAITEGTIPDYKRNKVLKDFKWKFIETVREYKEEKKEKRQEEKKKMNEEQKSTQDHTEEKKEEENVEEEKKEKENKKNKEEENEKWIDKVLLEIGHNDENEVKDIADIWLFLSNISEWDPEELKKLLPSEHGLRGVLLSQVLQIFKGRHEFILPALLSWYKVFSEEIIQGKDEEKEQVNLQALILFSSFSIFNMLKTKNKLINSEEFSETSDFYYDFVTDLWIFVKKPKDLKGMHKNLRNFLPYLFRIGFFNEFAKSFFEDMIKPNKKDFHKHVLGIMIGRAIEDNDLVTSQLLKLIDHENKTEQLKGLMAFILKDSKQENNLKCLFKHIWFPYKLGINLMKLSDQKIPNKYSTVVKICKDHCSNPNLIAALYCLNHGNISYVPIICEALKIHGQNVTKSLVNIFTLTAKNEENLKHKLTFVQQLLKLDYEDESETLIEMICGKWPEYARYKSIRLFICDSSSEYSLINSVLEIKKIADQNNRKRQSLHSKNVSEYCHTFAEWIFENISANYDEEKKSAINTEEKEDESTLEDRKIKKDEFIKKSKILILACFGEDKNVKALSEMFKSKLSNLNSLF
jgi:hypothetical protein